MVSRARVFVSSVLAFGALACGSGDPMPSSDPERRSVAGCVDGDPNLERRGTACLCCHRGEFSVAGSVAGDPATILEIRVEDAVGGSAVMVPNAQGNFFRHNRLVPPLRATLVRADGRVSVKQVAVLDGDCNRCHSAAGTAGPLGLP